MTLSRWRWIVISTCALAVFWSYHDYRKLHRIIFNGLPSDDEDMGFAPLAELLQNAVRNGHGNMTLFELWKQYDIDGSTDRSSSNVRGIVPGSVALVDYCTGESFETIRPLVYYNRRYYANKWGYQVYRGTSEDLPFESFVTPRVWIKLVYLFHLLNTQQQQSSMVEWFLWLDCDALVARFDWSIPKVLEDIAVKPEHNMVVAVDPSSLFNAGVMFIRNCEWSRNLFKRTLMRASNETIRQQKWKEQKALQDLYHQNQHHEKRHIYITQEHWKINALRSNRRNYYNSSFSFIWHRVNCLNKKINQTTCDERSRAFFCAKMPSGSYPSELCKDVAPETPW